MPTWENAKIDRIRHARPGQYGPHSLLAGRVVVDAKAEQLVAIRDLLKRIGFSFDQAIVRTVNKAAVSLRGDVTDAVTAMSGLKRTYIRKMTYLVRARGRSGGHVPKHNAHLVLFIRPVPVGRLDPAQTKTGVEFSYLGARQTIPRAWFMRGTRYRPRGFRHKVFLRQAKGRFPIQSQTRELMADAWPRIEGASVRNAAELLSRYMGQQVDWLLEKAEAQGRFAPGGLVEQALSEAEGIA